ncbi:TPA: glycosyltransferase [Klebsiella pneumoniae]|uniref:glycosyltransferase n=1 Tax=Klebsiella pneumoniae TaxID=573 RepID=UPI0014355C7A|nr:glycosyltransferase [Klebsiella pneumoniae]QIV49599.1 glycosyltransferase [Klebsiella pneumoniae]URR04525.1 glycosyltransferase [Klebsiella pneumoniae]UZC99180.1 glycosyltransferase [Klebsiella pneumoniae]HBQ7336196.1 glycosyltransferase [Klebsiella pneumoniae]HBV1996268.1 glycosyltransferase [Klebsiella pneumoniae]
MKAYFYPPLFRKTKGVHNPYSKNFISSLSKHYKVNSKPAKTVGLLDLFCACFSTDIVILNWVDNIAFKKMAYFQYILFNIILKILVMRNVCVVWVLHNIHPHKGENALTNKINNLMCKYSDLVIVHSSEAKNYISRHTKAQVCFLHHPIEPIALDNQDSFNSCITFDFLIWGSIEPYKGILEFLQFCYNNKKVTADWRIKIVGLCKDKAYEEEVKKYISPNVIYENRKIEFQELAKEISLSQFVLFPYTSSSVSSSGALMDSLALGANIIGPSKGAFKDLAKNGICFVYESLEDLPNLKKRFSEINKTEIQFFVHKHSWDDFANNVSGLINTSINEKSKHE